MFEFAALGGCDLWYNKRDCSPKLVLFFQAKLSIAENSNILNILRMSTFQGQIMLIRFQQSIFSVFSSFFYPMLNSSRGLWYSLPFLWIPWDSQGFLGVPQFPQSSLGFFKVPQRFSWYFRVRQGSLVLLWAPQGSLGLPIKIMSQPSLGYIALLCIWD